MAKHVTQMSFDFLHNGDFPTEWLERHIRQTVEETLKAYDLQYLGATFESMDHAYKEMLGK